MTTQVRNLSRKDCSLSNQNLHIKSWSIGKFPTRGTKTLFKTLSFLIYLIWLSTSALFAQFDQPHPSLPTFLPLNQQGLQRSIGPLGLTQDEWASLAQYGATVRIQTHASSGDLNPAQGEQRVIEQRPDRTRANIGIETLMILPIPTYLRSLNREQQLLVLYNSLHRFSTMTGINYWSQSRQRFREFYTLSHLVNPQNRSVAVQDPRFSSIPPQSTLILRQIDSSFGENFFRVQVNQFSQPTLSSETLPIQGFHLYLTNETSLRQGIITLARPEEVTIDLIIGIQEGYFLFYGTTDLTVPQVFGLRDRAAASFYHRLMALYRWFYDQIQL